MRKFFILFFVVQFYHSFQCFWCWILQLSWGHLLVKILSKYYEGTPALNTKNNIDEEHWVHSGTSFELFIPLNIITANHLYNPIIRSKFQSHSNLVWLPWFDRYSSYCGWWNRPCRCTRITSLIHAYFAIIAHVLIFTGLNLNLVFSGRGLMSMSIICKSFA